MSAATRRSGAGLQPRPDPPRSGIPSRNSALTPFDSPIVLLDSAAAITAAHEGAVVVTGSHGGLSAAAFALAVPLRAVAFNDAGGGKDGAGFAGLSLLDEAGIAAFAVSHESARIGDAADTLASGVVSHANHTAECFGIRSGQTAHEAVRRLANKP